MATVTRALVTLTAVSEGVANGSGVSVRPSGLSTTQSFTVHGGDAGAVHRRPLVPGVTPVQADHFTERRARIDAPRRVAGLQAFPGTTVRGAALRVGAVRSPQLRATRLRGTRLAGLPPAGQAQVSRRGARRTVRRRHDPRADDTRRRASGVHQAGIPLWRWPTSRSAILLQLPASVLDSRGRGVRGDGAEVCGRSVPVIVSIDAASSSRSPSA